MRHRRNTKKRGTQPFFCRPAWFLRTQQSALQCGGGKQYAAIKHGAQVFPAFTPSRARVRRFRGITASTRSPILHPAPAVSGETGIPTQTHTANKRPSDSMLQPSWGGRGRRGGPSPEGSLLSPASSLGGCVRSVAVRSPALSQWRTIQNSRGGVGKRHVFGTRFPV